MPISQNKDLVRAAMAEVSPMQNPSPERVDLGVELAQSKDALLPALQQNFLQDGRG